MAITIDPRPMAQTVPQLVFLYPKREPVPQKLRST